MPQKRLTELFFIGHKFYDKSGSRIGVLYKVSSGRRSDWGNVSKMLADGQEVHIRPATLDELEFYERKLAEMKAEDAEYSLCWELGKETEK